MGIIKITDELNSLGDPPWATKITSVGSIIYIAIAPPGSAQSAAVWKCKSIDSVDPNNIVIKWADQANPSQVATDLPSLTYS